MKPITISDVLKKDLRVISYMLIFGGVTLLSRKYLQTGDASVIVGAVANYIVYRIKQELENEGYNEALRAK